MIIKINKKSKTNKINIKNHQFKKCYNKNNKNNKINNKNYKQNNKNNKINKNNIANLYYKILIIIRTREYLAKSMIIIFMMVVQNNNLRSKIFKLLKMKIFNKNYSMHKMITKSLIELLIKLILKMKTNLKTVMYHNLKTKIMKKKYK